MQRVIITGANSFLGREIVSAAEGKYKIYPIVRIVTKADEISCSMNEYKKLDLLIKEPCDSLICLAWNGTRGETRSNPEIQRQNLEYSLDLLEFAKRNGVKNVILAGSQAEYGVCDEEITEETVCKPVTEYGKYKKFFYEKALESGLNVKNARIFSLYGEGDYKGSMIMSVLEKMMKNEDCELTDSLQMWDYLQVKDAAEALVRLLEKGEIGAYNVASDSPRPLKEYILEMQRITGSKSRLLFGAKQGTAGIFPNIEKMKKIGWQPKISFEAGIKALIN